MKYSWNDINIILQGKTDPAIMRIENTIDKLKAFLLWIYIMAVLAGIAYAVYMGQESKTPGEIIYGKTHTR